MTASPRPLFTATVPNKMQPTGKSQVGMQATEDSRPVHRVYVDGFWIDKTDVTNAEFGDCLRACGFSCDSHHHVDVLTIQRNTEDISCRST